MKSLIEFFSSVKLANVLLIVIASASILGILLSFNLVNFKAGQYSGIQMARDPGVLLIWGGSHS